MWNSKYQSLHLAPQKTGRGLSIHPPTMQANPLGNRVSQLLFFHFQNWQMDVQMPESLNRLYLLRDPCDPPPVLSRWQWKWILIT